MEGLSGPGMGLFSKMVNSWKRGQFCDVTIKCLNLRKVTAPSILLGTVSNLLSDYLSQCCDLILTTSEISFHMWNALLMILYDGNVDAITKGGSDQPTLWDMKVFADSLDVSSVVEMCEKAIAQTEEPSIEEKYNYITKIPFEFNLVFHVETNQGKARVTVQCRSAPTQDEITPPATKDEDEKKFIFIQSDEIQPGKKVKASNIDASNMSTPTKKKSVTISKTSPKADIKLKVENDQTPSTARKRDDSNSEPGSSRRSARSQGKRKKYTPYGVKQESDESEAEEEDIPKEEMEFLDDEDKDVDFVASEDELKEVEKEDETEAEQMVEEAEETAEMKEEGEGEEDKEGVDNVLYVSIDEMGAVVNSDALLSKKVKTCFECGDNCTSDYVQCRLCFQFVEGSSLTHVENEHPFLNNQLWPVTCDVDSLQPNEEAMLIGKTTYASLMDGDLGILYECMECIDMFSQADEYENHLRNHADAVFICQNKDCHFAFREELYRREHQHFCKGRDLVKCVLCKQVLGGMMAFSKHKCGTKTQMKKSSPNMKSHMKQRFLKAEKERKVRSANSKPPQRVKSICPNKLPYHAIRDQNVVQRMGTDYVPVNMLSNAVACHHLKKCCRHCGNDCQATEVMCLYCGVHVSLGDEAEHVRTMHPDTPSNCLWPVTCQNLSKKEKQFAVCKFYEKGVAGKSGEIFVEIQQPLDDRASSSTPRDVADQETKEAASQIVAVKAADGINTTEGVSSHGSRGVCYRCTFECSTREALVNHMRDTHNRRVTFCKTCDCGIDSPSHFTTHTFYCEGNMFYACARCEMQYVGGVEDLKKHEESTHSSTVNLDRKLFREMVRKPKDIMAGRVQRCFQCGPKGCVVTTRDVKCVYCNMIVPNNIKHMEEYHPFTLPRSVWPVTCRYQTGKCLQQGNPVVGTKTLPDPNNEYSKVFECHLCKYKCTSCKSMVSHVKSKHAKFARECVICETVFNRYETWRDHEHFCAGGDILICNICDTICGGLKVLNDHLCRNHPDDKGLITPKKPQQTKVDSDEEGWSDIEGDIGVKPDNVSLMRRNQLCFCCGSKGCVARQVKCIYCHEVTSNHMQHMLQHPFTPLGSPWIVTCLLIDDVKYKILLSERIFAGKAMRIKLKCMLCNNFNASGDREMCTHLNKKHRIGDGIRRCKHCGSMFNDYEHYRNHEHYCGGGKMIKCDICDTELGGFAELWEHFKAKHPGDKETMVDPVTGTVTEVNLLPHDSEAARLIQNYVEGQQEPDEVYAASQNEFATTEERKQDCFVCEGPCKNARMRKNMVKCLLCNFIVPNKMSHMTEKHRHTAPTSDWAVSCKSFRQSAQPIDYSVVCEKSKEDIPTKLKCLLCDFYTEVDGQLKMKLHFKDKHKSPLYFCSLCSQGFKKAYLKRDHERFCGGNGFLSCTYCGRRCSGYENFYNHINDKHGEASKATKRKLPADYDESEEDALNTTSTSLKGVKRKAIQRLMANYDPDETDPDENGVVTLCGVCGTDCLSHNVRCLLCFKVVSKDSLHLLQEHAYTPHKTWVVSCKNTNQYKGVSKKGKTGSADPQHLIVGRAQSIAYMVHQTEDSAVIDESQVGDRVALDIQCAIDHGNDVIPQCPDMDHLLDHLSREHSRLQLSPVQLCQHCNHVFSLHDPANKRMFQDHEHFCGGNGLYQCDQCGARFSAQKRLTEHNSLVHKPLSNQVKGYLPQPVHVPKGSFIQCIECEFQATSLKEYKNHAMSTHQFKITNIQVCRYCLKAFKVTSKREMHEQQAHMNGEKLRCEVCSKLFNTPTSLRAHIKYYHEGGRIKQKLYRDNRPKLPCSYCGKLFALAIHVRNHELTTHMNHKPYQCRVCGQRFTNHSACRTHEDRHTGQKRYKCPYCDYRAYKGSRVNEHIKTKHPGKGKAFGHHLVEIGSHVIDKGDEFIIDEGIVYKPRNKREEFDFGDYEEKIDGGVDKRQDVLIQSLNQQVANNIVNINLVPDETSALTIDQTNAGANPRMYIIKTEGENGEMAICMSEAELRALETKEGVKYIMNENEDAALQVAVEAAGGAGDPAIGVDADTGNAVQYVIDSGVATAHPGAGGDDVDVKYVVQESIMDQDASAVQYALSKDVQYVIDTENIGEEAKQEVEFIINSAQEAATSSVGGQRSVLKSFLRGAPSAPAEVASYTDESSDNARQVFYIVNNT